MGGFFNIDGPFYKFGNIIADIMILSFTWLFFSIIGLGLTTGASTTALFYVTTRRISNREGYLLRDFWKSFKQNFKQATIAWVCILLIGLILLTNMLNMNNIDMPYTMKMILQPLQIVFFIELTLVNIYIFPIIARFEMSLKDVLKTTVFMIHKHLFSSIILLLMVVASYLACYMYPLFAVVAMGTYAFGASYFFIRIFKKYRPEIDKDPLEDIENTDEE